MRMRGVARTASLSARMISCPVASKACRMRRCECPPSWPRSYAQPSKSSRPSKRTPRPIRSRTRSGPSRTTTSTTSRWQRPAPAPRVSSMCDSKESSGLQTDAMPPWAYWLELSGRRSLVTRSTLPAAAQRRAQVRPAMPLPTTRKSASMGSGLHIPAHDRSGQAVDGRAMPPYAPPPMRAAAGVAVGLGVVSWSARRAAADIYLLRDRKGVLHITNAPVDPGIQLVVRQPPRVARPNVLTVEGRERSRARIVLPVVDPGLGPLAFLPRPLPIGPRRPAPPVPPGAPTPFDEMIRVIADRYDVEYSLVKAVIKAESGFNHLAVSPKGAQGLMQLMPETAAEVRVQDAFLPQDNIEGGVRYLRRMLERYEGNLALAVAAYNAGPTRVDDAGGVPDIAETREFLARVLRYRLGYLREGAGVRQALR